MLGSTSPRRGEVGRRLAGFAALGFGFFLIAAPAQACQCYNFSRAEIVQRADIVFEGTVAVVTQVRGLVQATIDVSRIEKGPPVTSVTLLTPGSTAACGVPFRVTQRVTVAAMRDGRVWRTDNCISLGLRPAPFVPNR